jgi:adenine phosphoribosyltransferase
MTTADINLKNHIRDIADFPKPGILFRDITPLLAAPKAFRAVIQRMSDHYRDRKVDIIIAAEARGFIFACPMAVELGVGFVPVRKPGKLPSRTHQFNYDLEYGQDSLEIHVDGIEPGQRVLIVDDLLATGGTVEACCKLVEKSGAEVVGCAFLIELTDLNGAQRIAPREVFRLIEY